MNEVDDKFISLPNGKFRCAKCGYVYRSYRTYCEHCDETPVTKASGLRLSPGVYIQEIDLSQRDYDSGDAKVNY